MKISYYAVFEYAGDGINITFPDIPEALTCAYSRKESIKMAKEVLELSLHKKRYSDLPKPIEKNKIFIKDNTEIVEITISMKLQKDLLLGNEIIEIN